MPQVAIEPNEAAPQSFIPRPPVRLAYEMPFADFQKIRLATAEGTDVRRLFAEVPRAAGAVREGCPKSSTACPPPGPHPAHRSTQEAQIKLIAPSAG
jgi:hypothetical protein